MNYNDVIVRLAYLTKRNNITQKELADILNIERQSMNGRAERNSKFKASEIQAIEKYFNIDLNSVNISVSSEKFLNISSDTEQNKKSVKEKLADFNIRLAKVQQLSGLSDEAFAKIIGLYRDEYIDFKTGERKPDLRLVNEIKENFKISADWLLYGG